jgi:hypothetical protein
VRQCARVTEDEVEDDRRQDDGCIFVEQFDQLMSSSNKPKTKSIAHGLDGLNG